MPYFIGIDFGTSGARAVAIDPTAEVQAQASVDFANSVDWVVTWRGALFDLLAQLPQQCRSQAHAIALNGTSSTVLLCDAAGNPVTEPLLYNDDRAAGELEPLREQLERSQSAAPDPSREIVLSATSSLVKLLWWQRRAIAAQYFLHQADWLGFLLHGQLGFSDYHNSLKLGYDVRRLCYPAWMQPLGVQPLLPKVLPPGTPIAPVTPEISTRFGFPPTCQGCAGTTDSVAAFLASGAATPGEAVTSLGSTLVLKLLSETPVDNGQYGIYSHRLGDRWLVGGASNTGGAVLKQFFSSAELERWSAEIPADRESPLHYYPLPHPGERFPINDPALPPQLEPRPSDPIAFLHGLLESIARIEARGYQLLQALGATPLQRVQTAGGGAANETWTKIRARHLGVPVGRSSQTEAAYGTARLARASFL